MGDLRVFAETMRRAVMVASRAELGRIAGTIWQAYGAGAIGEGEAQDLAELVEARKAVPVDRPAPRRVGSRPRSAASLERRRRWVSAGLMPPTIACQFTMGEAAALAVIAAECSKRRACTLTVGAIAGAAGVSESTVRNAIRSARAAGILQVRERRISRWRNDSNVVSIVSAEWRTWLRIGGSGGGCKTLNRTPTQILKPAFSPFELMQRGRRVVEIGPPAARGGRGRAFQGRVHCAKGQP